MKKLSKTIVTVLLILVVICILFFLYIKLVDKLRTEKEETEFFEEYKTDFEKVNEYILKNFDNKQTNEEIRVVMLDKHAASVRGLYDNGEVNVGKDLRESLNSIVPAFMGYEFSDIAITDDSVSYRGLGYRMYVYSRNGKPPRYFYNRGDGMHPDVYNLGDNWYLMIVNYL